MHLSQVKWKMKNIIGISGNAANMQKALRLYGCPYFGCACHTLNLAVSKELEETTVKRVVGKVRSLVAAFKTSYIKTELLHQNQAALDLKQLQLKQDVATRWANSVYYMVERLLVAYAAVFASIYAGTSKSLLLSDAETSLLNQQVTVLAPFERVTKKPSKEKAPTAGLILPYWKKLTQVDLAPKGSDLPTITKLKAIAKGEMDTRYTEPAQRELLCRISSLDPRVKSLDWLSDTERDKVFSSLTDECLALPVKRKVPSVPTPNIHVKQEPGLPETAPDPEPGPSTEVDDDLDAVIFIRHQLPKSDKEVVSEEVQKYRSEPSFGSSQEPLSWWKLNKEVYPNLSNLMLRYLNVPASSVPSERVFSTAGKVLEKTRASLDPESANILIFLYHNYKKYRLVVDPEWAMLC